MQYVQLFYNRREQIQQIHSNKYLIGRKKKKTKEFKYIDTFTIQQYQLISKILMTLIHCTR